MTINEWILASASPRRRDLLSSLGMRFKIDPSKAEEPPRRPSETPSGYVMRLARLKVEEVSRRHHQGLVIGADTVVVVQDLILGKPASKIDGRRMLRSLSGRWHEVVSGVCLLQCGSKSSRTAASRARVHFRRLTNDEIEWYLDTGEYKDKAGAYAIQGYASLFIDRIEGCYFNVVGLPLAVFHKLCRHMGIDLLQILEKS
jgi:nucleoside triphosphate pyrophosphatase